MAKLNQELIARAMKRAQANDAEEMITSEESRRAGLTPAVRLQCYMEGMEIEPLGDVGFIYRSDLVSAAPDHAE